MNLGFLILKEILDWYRSENCIFSVCSLIVKNECRTYDPYHEFFSQTPDHSKYTVLNSIQIQMMTACRMQPIYSPWMSMNGQMVMRMALAITVIIAKAKVKKCLINPTALYAVS